MKIHLGFVNFPYQGRYGAESPLTATVKKKRQRTLSKAQTGYGEGRTTAEVAEELEKRYNIVETFFDLEKDKILEMIEEAFAEDAEIVMMGQPPRTGGLSDKATDKIEQSFRRNLAAQKYDGLIRGVPTLASLRGVSHLKLHPFAKRNSSRPSFIDTGMYQRSFTVWAEADEDD